MPIELSECGYGRVVSVEGMKRKIKQIEEYSGDVVGVLVCSSIADMARSVDIKR